MRVWTLSRSVMERYRILHRDYKLPSVYEEVAARVKRKDTNGLNDGLEKEYSSCCYYFTIRAFIEYDCIVIVCISIACITRISCI